ncbi:MAG: hypothetical protein CMJ72_12740 [Planctomycetaceae bacterium]|nr:hypothetical protein [Planctomycetaceae bacterium]
MNSGALGMSKNAPLPFSRCHFLTNRSNFRASESKSGGFNLHSLRPAYFESASLRGGSRGVEYGLDRFHSQEV